MSDLVIGNEDYYRGYQQGREEAEEEVENRYNRVLDDEKRISYEQGKADMLNEFTMYLANNSELGNVAYLYKASYLSEQLKEQK